MREYLKAITLMCALVTPIPEWKCFPDGTCVLNGFSLRWSGNPKVITREEPEYDNRFLKDTDPFNYPDMDENIEP